MSATVRNVLAVIAGLIVGIVANMVLITVGPMVIPPPEGLDMTDAASLAAGAHLLEPRHFLFPWLAHAADAFVGALVAIKLAASHHARLAWIVGGFAMLGGILAAFMIPAPAWFLVADLGLAYLPMAWLAIRLAAPRPA